MKSRGFMENGSRCILKAIQVLYKEISESSLNNSEKNVLIKLIENLEVYYNREYNGIIESCFFNINNKLNRLFSNMIDYIVAINDVINKKNDAYSTVNMIYKEINYDDRKEIFKRKRLI